jgi:hypothetical protein
MQERRWRTFQHPATNSTGDLALRWEVARNLALRTPTVSCFVEAHKTHAIVGILGFQPGETSSLPSDGVLPAPEDFSAQGLLAFS